METPSSMHQTPSEFTDAERVLVSSLLLERYSSIIALQVADAELQLDPERELLSVCPCLYWEARGANFVVMKLAESRFRCQFFYSDQEQFGTGREVFDSLGDCVITLLQVQADHEHSRQGGLGGMSVKELPAEPAEDAYVGPIVI